MEHVEDFFGQLTKNPYPEDDKKLGGELFEAAEEQSSTPYTSPSWFTY